MVRRSRDERAYLIPQECAEWISEHKPRKVYRRFLFNALAGLSVLTVFFLAFLPRSSLSRDLGRLHKIHVPLIEIEREFVDLPLASSIRNFSHYYTSGNDSPGENGTHAEWTSDKFKSYGFPTTTYEYEVYLNHPVDYSLNLIGENGISYSATLEEDILDQDEASKQDEYSTFHGYSASGNVTAQYVYANFGRPEDYNALINANIDINGKIVLIKYGKLSRGLKVAYAEDFGAIGAILYSDPQEDGEIIEDNGFEPYPEGPARNPSAIQRGSVLLGAGDPTTPGWASKPGCDRVDPSESLPKIPSIPISYRDAEPFLKRLEGQGLLGRRLGKDWQGHIKDLDYFTGPSESEKINLYSLQKYDYQPIYNVVARIEGINPDQVVIIGNHRDSWTAGGAGDPSSGSAILMELARSFSELRKRGWRPARTILLASWDAEEYGLLGSTEWGEDNAPWLDKKVIAYINVDVGVSGDLFSAKGSPLFERLVREMTQRIGLPDDDESIYRHWMRDSGGQYGILDTDDSDFSVFMHHLGIPSLDLGFESNANSPVYHYHSKYDSFYWMEHFGDPTWRYHETLTKLIGLLSISLVDTEALKFTIGEYCSTLLTEVGKVETLFPEEWNNKRNADVWNQIRNLKAAISLLRDVGIRYDEEMARLRKLFNADFAWFQIHKKLAVLWKIDFLNVRLARFERFMIQSPDDDNNPRESDGEKTLFNLYQQKNRNLERGQVSNLGDASEQISEGFEYNRWTDFFRHAIFAPPQHQGPINVAFPGIIDAIHEKDKDNLSKAFERIIRNLYVARDDLQEALKGL